MPLPVLVAILAITPAQAGQLTVAPLAETICSFPAGTLGTPVDALYPGTDQRLGRVYADQPGTTVTATLGLDSGRPAMRAQVQDKVVDIIVDFDPEGYTALELTRDLRQGALLLTEGAGVRVLGFEAGAVLVGPYYPEVPPAFIPASPVVVQVSCADLRFKQQHDLDDSEAARARVGIEDSALVYLKVGARLFDAPQGAQVGTFAPRLAFKHGYRLSQRAGWTEVVVPDIDGAFWRGWTRDLDSAPRAVGRSHGEPQLSIAGIVGRDSGNTPPVYRSCPTDQPLFAVLEYLVEPVGSLRAGAVFIALGDGPEETLAIQPIGGAFSLAGSRGLALGPEARACPEVPPSR